MSEYDERSETWEQEKIDWAYPHPAPLAIPDDLPELGPDAIIRTDGPTKIDHPNRYPVSSELHPDWTPMPWVATNAVEHEFDTLERYLKELIKSHDDQYAQGNFEEITVSRISLGAVIGQTQRLIERYKELYKIASSVVNAEQLRRFEA